MARFIERSYGLKITLRKPTDYMVYARMFGTLAAIGLSLVFASSYVIQILTNRRLWATMSIVVCLLMTSGFMWNQIRQPPFIAADPHTRQPQLIAGGFQNQYGVETQIMALLYALCSYAVVLLATRAPKLENPLFQRTAVYAGMALLVVGHSVTLALFHKKNSSYPFNLFTL
jgi:oligosaccharyltransferase complex subunit gamma